MTKKIITASLLLLAVTVLFAACKKEEYKVSHTIPVGTTMVDVYEDEEGNEYVTNVDGDMIPMTSSPDGFYDDVESLFTETTTKKNKNNKTTTTKPAPSNSATQNAAGGTETTQNAAGGTETTQNAAGSTETTTQNSGGSTETTTQNSGGNIETTTQSSGGNTETTTQKPNETTTQRQEDSIEWEDIKNNT